MTYGFDEGSEEVWGFSTAGFSVRCGVEIGF
jgi:hypothetical protein